MPWYDYRDSITKVVIEEGVTGVGVQTFAFCYNLTEVELPMSVGLPHKGLHTFRHPYVKLKTKKYEDFFAKAEEQFLLCRRL